MHISIDDHNDATPLIDIQINIDKSLKECRQIKEQRMSELNRLQEEVILTYYPLLYIFNVCLFAFNRKNKFVNYLMKNLNTLALKICLLQHCWKTSKVIL